MNVETWSTGRVAGVLLLGTLVPFAIIVILAVRGELPSMYGLFWPIEELNEHLPVSGWALPAQTAYGVLWLVGFGMLSVALRDSGESSLWLLSFGLMVVSVAMMSFEGTFYQSVNPWAAQEAARTGATPELFEAMHHWMNTSVQMIYMLFGLVAFAGYGWAVLRTGLVHSWVGWASIGWGGVWLVFTVASQTTLPLALFVWPLVVGIALVVKA